MVAGWFLVTGSVNAEDWKWGGHLKAQYSQSQYDSSDVAALYGENPARDQFFDGRLKADWRRSGFDFSIHYEVLALVGNSVETRRALNTAGLVTTGTATGLPNDRQRLFDLTHEIFNDSQAVAVHRLDRLAVGYGNGTWLVRFGRQAVSWGNGLVFQVLDVVNPFPPLAIDKDYKPGDDMLYAQWQSGSQQDVQTMVVPRRTLMTHAIASQESSYAAKWRSRIGGFDLDLMAARHYDETLLGAGIVHGLGGAVWRLDVANSQIRDTDSAWSLVTNIDYSWVLFGKNMYGFMEYFRSGVGEAYEQGYTGPNAALTARLFRGEVYTLARDYAALGVQVEFTPLVNGFFYVIQNLNDGSRLWQWRAVYDWRQNTQFMAGVNLPDGKRGSEYGGFAVPNPVPPPALGFLAPGRAAFIRAVYYF